MGKQKRRNKGRQTDQEFEKPTLRNTATWTLDGTPTEVLSSFEALVKYIRYWNYQHGIKVDISSVTGITQEVYTTPEDGTFFVAVKFGPDSLIFVVDARTGWLKGFVGDNGVFEFEPDSGESPYMIHPKAKLLPFTGNYHNISGGDAGYTETNLYALRKAFKILLKYKSRSQEPQGFRRALGIFCVYLCEAPKLDPVLDLLFQSFTDDDYSILNKHFPTIGYLTRSWSNFSDLAKNYILCALKGSDKPLIENKHRIPNVDTIEGILATVRILQLDGINEGVFKHKARNTPITWHPIDEGEGDDAVVRIPDFIRENTTSKKKNRKERGEQSFQNKWGRLINAFARGGQAGGQPTEINHRLTQISQKSLEKPPNFISHRKMSSETKMAVASLVELRKDMIKPAQSPDNLMTKGRLGPFQVKDRVVNFVNENTNYSRLLKKVTQETQLRVQLHQLQLSPCSPNIPNIQIAIKGSDQSLARRQLVPDYHWSLRTPKNSSHKFEFVHYETNKSLQRYDLLMAGGATAKFQLLQKGTQETQSRVQLHNLSPSSSRIRYLQIVVKGSDQGLSKPQLAPYYHWSFRTHKNSPPKFEFMRHETSKSLQRYDLPMAEGATAKFQTPSGLRLVGPPMPQVKQSYSNYAWKNVGKLLQKVLRYIPR